MKNIGYILAVIVALLLMTFAIFSSSDENNISLPQEISKPNVDNTNKPLENNKISTADQIIYDYYWEILNVEGNPRGYINHPTTFEAANEWEADKMLKVLNEYDITEDELFRIIIDVAFSEYK